MYDKFNNDGQRKVFAQLEMSRLIQKGIQRIVQLPRYVRMKNTHKLDKIKRSSSIVRVKNRCIKTHRPRGILSSFNLSRLEFRRMSRNGLLKGLRQSSW